MYHVLNELGSSNEKDKFGYTFFICRWRWWEPGCRTGGLSQQLGHHKMSLVPCARRLLGALRGSPSVWKKHFQCFRVVWGKMSAFGSYIFVAKLILDTRIATLY